MGPAIIGRPNQYGALMIIVCVSILPVLIMFLAMQRQFVAGLLGSVK
jgi:ABC-type glycerol-3-phosphate transport system permease component